MINDPYGVAIEELGLSAGTLSELNAMGITNVGMAIELVNEGNDVVRGTPDLQALDLSELEERLVMAGYLNEYDDELIDPIDDGLFY